MRRAIEEHLRAMYVRNYSVRTIHIRRSHLGEFANWLRPLGIDEPQQVTRSVLEQYRAWLHAQGTRSVGTQSRLLTSVRTLFRFLVRTGRLDVDPALHLELPRMPKPIHTTVLTRDEIDRLLALPDPSTTIGLRDRAILETFFATGIRRQELIRLAIDDKTHVEIRAEHVPHGISAEDHAVGLASSLANLARYTERQAASMHQDA
jgi:integrase/recombinase XerD